MREKKTMEDMAWDLIWRQLPFHKSSQHLSLLQDGYVYVDSLCHVLMESHKDMWFRRSTVTSNVISVSAQMFPVFYAF